MSHAFIPSSNSPVASFITVTASSAQVLANNGLSRYRSFKNCSQTVAIWLGLGVPAVVNSGVCIEPRGTYEMAYAYQNMFPGNVFGITEGGSVVLAMMEQSPNT